ncbi:hypothetical protein PG984_012028 [Apiospora sp. TS-2023a]
MSRVYLRTAGENKGLGLALVSMVGAARSQPWIEIVSGTPTLGAVPMTSSISQARWPQSTARTVVAHALYGKSNSFEKTSGSLGQASSLDRGVAVFCGWNVEDVQAR